MIQYADTLGVRVPKNVGDLLYSFRYRARLPASIQETAGQGQAWIIRPAGRGQYRFSLVVDNPLTPNRILLPVKLPDATPGIFSKYASKDEQALLSKVRYNRLIDVLGITCYPIQGHLRTTVPGMGQVETDELYVGIDKGGAHYVIPIQAKGGTDRLGMLLSSSCVTVS